MLFSYFFLSSLTLALAQQSINSTAQNATAFALLYGYPLLAFQKLASPFIESDNTNKLVHARQLATASETAVVKPNVDTLYSVAIYDLGGHHVELTVPEIPSNQYALLSFYDPFGDNFANIGTGNFNQSGNYTLRKSQNDDHPIGVFPADNASDSTVASIHSPTSHGILLIRWLVDGNYDDIHTWQDRTLLTASRYMSGSDLQNISNSINQSSVADSVLKLLARYNYYDPPQLPDQVDVVNSQLRAAGITERPAFNRSDGRAAGHGTYNSPPGIDLEAANRTALASAAAAAAASSNNVPQNNGWCITKPAVSGNFENGTNHAYRAAIASSAFLMLQAPNAVYPSWTNSSFGKCSDASQEYTLGPRDSYIYTFSGRPPIQSTGFWSLTAYSNNYLIPNDLDRYGLGDRSNLTFADGRAVSGGDDGVFQILIQPADVPPPTNWTSNWLPAPAGGGNVTALLRWFGADKELVNGSYEYPIVSKQAAVVESTMADDGTSNSTETVSENSAAVLQLSWLISSAVMVFLVHWAI